MRTFSGLSTVGSTHLQASTQPLTKVVGVVVPPIRLFEITDIKWADIRQFGLPDEARTEISAALGAYHDDLEREIEVCCKTTKNEIHSLLTWVVEGSRRLGNLAHAENYRWYNNGGKRCDTLTLEQTQDCLARLRERLEHDRLRFQKKSRRDRDRIRKVSVVRELLIIRSTFTVAKLPVQVDETKSSGPFVRYLEICTGFTGQSLAHILIDVVAQIKRERKTPRR